jgi:hypothetical protein
MIQMDGSKFYEPILNHYTYPSKNNTYLSTNTLNNTTHSFNNTQYSYHIVDAYNNNNDTNSKYTAITIEPMNRKTQSTIVNPNNSGEMEMKLKKNIS